MPRTWLSIRVDLLGGGAAGALWPSPGRVLTVGPSHTFADLAAAIDDAFARWDRSHLYEFTLADGRRVGLPDEDDDAMLDAARLKVVKSVELGSEFRYVFDFGDQWTHRCTVEPVKVDPLDVLGIVPDRPLPSFGWGSIPDQYGRAWLDDDGESPPPAPAEPDPMLSHGWPELPSSGLPRLSGADLRDLRGATARGDRDAVRALLTGRDPSLLLQHAGEALLSTGVDGVEDLARDVARRLRDRDQDGDDVLALALDARCGGPQPALRPVRADLEMVADLLSGDPLRGGGYVDLTTGEVWPDTVLEDLDEDDTPDVDAEPDRWLHIENEGSRDRWNDRHDFAERLPPGHLREALLDALEGAGAFRRFARVLDRAPDVLVEWRAFSAERDLGRARAVLASFGCLAGP